MNEKESAGYKKKKKKNLFFSPWMRFGIEFSGAAHERDSLRRQSERSGQLSLRGPECECLLKGGAESFVAAAVNTRVKGATEICWTSRTLSARPANS